MAQTSIVGDLKNSAGLIEPRKNLALPSIHAIFDSIGGTTFPSQSSSTKVPHFLQPDRN